MADQKRQDQHETEGPEVGLENHQIQRGPRNVRTDPSRRGRVPHRKGPRRLRPVCQRQPPRDHLENASVGSTMTNLNQNVFLREEKSFQ